MSGPLDFDQIVHLAAASPASHTRLTQLLSEVDAEVSRIMSRADGAPPAPLTTSILTAASESMSTERGPQASPNWAIVERLCDRIGGMQRALKAPSAKQSPGVNRTGDSGLGAASARSIPSCGGPSSESAGLSRLEEMLCQLESQVCRSLSAAEGELCAGASAKPRLDELSAEVEALQRRKLALQEDVNALRKQKNELEGGISALHWCRGGFSMQLGHMSPRAASTASNLSMLEPYVAAQPCAVAGSARTPVVGGGLLSVPVAAAGGLQGPVVPRTAAGPRTISPAQSVNIPVAPRIAGGGAEAQQVLCEMQPSLVSPTSPRTCRTISTPAVPYPNFQRTGTPQVSSRPGLYINQQS